MLYELAYPILFAGAKTQQVATRTRVRLGLAPRELRHINYRPETRFRILCWYLRKADIALLSRAAPGRAAKVALKRLRRWHFVSETTGNGSHISSGELVPGMSKVVLKEGNILPVGTRNGLVSALA